MKTLFDWTHLCYHGFMRSTFIPFIIITLILALLFSSCQSTPDYSDPSTWAYLAAGEDKEADLFIICPTVDMGEEGNYNMRMEDEAAKASFIGALNMERGIYEDETKMYAPFYRQMTFPLYENGQTESGMPLEIAYSDIENAFFYYIDNMNDGRPFILAGFSQGAQLALMLLEEHFDDDALMDKLIAAYCIGWKITEEELDRYPHLKMAEREDDTGVIVSFNTEDPAIDDSIIVPEGTKTLAINPLSWSTGSGVASRELNMGACFTDYSGSVTTEIPYFTGTYLDEERGTLKVTDVIMSDYSNSLFPDGVYHLYDYQFFFRNLQDNVKKRVDAYFETFSY